MDAYALRDLIAAQLLAGYRWETAAGQPDYAKALAQAETLLNTASERDQLRPAGGLWPWQVRLVVKPAPRL